MNHYLLAKVDIGTATKINERTGISQTYNNFGTLINLVVRISIIAASIIFLFLLIFGGITFIINAGSGDSKKADQSKKTITAAVIGFVIVIFSYVIITIIETFTGLPILRSNL